MGDLFYKFFFKTTGDRIFLLTYKAIVGQAFLCKIFFRSKSGCRILFSESPIPCLLSYQFGISKPSINWNAQYLTELT